MTKILNLPASLLARALAASSEAALITDSQQDILYANAAFTAVTGYDQAEIVGRNCRFLQGPQTEPLMICKLRDALAAGNSFRGDILNYRKDGSPFWNELTISPLKDSHGRVTHFFSVQRDITAQRQLYDQLQHQALHDPLTGLANRLGLSQHLSRAITRSARNKTTLALGVIDLDDFKLVNDTWGHAAGDVLLQTFAKRLQSQLRDSDHLARLGGDEFVIILEELEDGHVTRQLATITERLHTAIETSFDIITGQCAEVGMSMGVALYPAHGTDPDSLLRQADAALYEAKTHKHDRARWWCFWNESAVVKPEVFTSETEFDPYSAEAAEVLHQIEGVKQQLIEQFVEKFYRGLQNRPDTAAIITQLSPKGFIQLQKMQGDYLTQLLSPSLSAIEHNTKAVNLGNLHARIGLSATDIVLAMQDYINLVHQMIQGLAWRLNRRAELTKIISVRLRREMQWQLEGMDQIDRNRQSLLLYLESKTETWAKDGSLVTSSLQAIMARMSSLCGIWYGGADAKNMLVAEQAFGCSAVYLQDLSFAGIELSFDSVNLHLSQSSTVRAWIEGQIATVPNYEVQPALEKIWPFAQKHGIRSSATIPVFGRDGNPVLVVTLLGKYPCQFEAWSTQLWLRSVQQFFQKYFLQHTKTGASTAFLSHEDRKHYRNLLHGGALRMHMQPIIDLHTGQIDKVEALARLQNDAELIPPDQFLPAYGSQDMAALFRIGLVQALDWLRQWDEAGLTLDLSINLPPSVLVMPECVAWVRYGLEAAGIAPHRLYLELLESEDGIDPTERDVSIAALGKTGVTLVMDDLGAGYNGLLRLQTLPFFAIKIDRHSVRQAANDPEKSIPFLGALIRIVHGMGMRVVMEGLESPELIEMAAAFGADWGQGYAISRPVPPETILNLVTEWVWTIDPDHPSYPLSEQARAFSQTSLVFDWQRAIETHLHWRHDFEMRIRGDGKPLSWQIICRDDKCFLGRWLYRQQRVCTAEQRPLLDKVITQHAAFHKIAGNLVRRVQQNEEIADVLVELRDGEIVNQSVHLVTLLNELIDLK